MISETYNFRDFCLISKFNNQPEAIDIVCDEIHALKRANKKNTGERKFREGSREKAYYDDLKTLMSIIVNTSLPKELRSGFLRDMYPLVLKLYRTNALMAKILKEIVRDGIISATFKVMGENESGLLP